MSALVVVESKSKVGKVAQILERLYGRGRYRVTASLGHIRDLPDDELGVAVEAGFKPRYVVIPKKQGVLKRLRREVEQADALYLASDPDREGESIAWHIVQFLRPQCPVYRVSFNAITESAIRAGFDAPRAVDMRLVAAQESRRVVDRLVGYRVSPALWRGLDESGLSAGRVQSVALRLAVERQREIETFEPQEYWSIRARFAVPDGEFQAELLRWQGAAWTQANCATQAAAAAICDQLQQQTFRVVDLETRQTRRRPPAPFITSTLQQAAATHLRLSTERTMQLAQSLYEQGYLTYMRTDSPALSPEAQAAAADIIRAEWGEQYHQARQFKARGSAQEAHEAVRPTDAACAEIPGADPLTQKFYSLIRHRFLASQMADAQYSQTTLDVAGEAGTLLRARGRRLQFAGFLAAYDLGADLNEDDEAEVEATLPFVTAGDSCHLRKVQPQQHFTRAPAAYSEAALVQALERAGIGRPSTYSAIIATLKQRQYVQTRRRRLEVTALGCRVSDFLVRHFALIFDPRFTALMEASLDRIAAGTLEASDFLQVFWDKLEPLLQPWQTAAPDPEDDAPSETCPVCGEGLMEIKRSRKGRFLGCERYPDCRYTRDIRLPKPNLIGRPCPRCGAQLAVRHTREGQPFVGCTAFPQCRHSEDYIEEAADGV